jgi:hypothetical protein
MISFKVHLEVSATRIFVRLKNLPGLRPFRPQTVLLCLGFISDKHLFSTIALICFEFSFSSLETALIFQTQ